MAGVREYCGSNGLQRVEYGATKASFTRNAGKITIIRSIIRKTVLSLLKCSFSRLQKAKWCYDVQYYFEIEWDF